MAHALLQLQQQHEEKAKIAAETIASHRSEIVELQSSFESRLENLEATIILDTTVPQETSKARVAANVTEERTSGLPVACTSPPPDCPAESSDAARLQDWEASRRELIECTHEKQRLLARVASLSHQLETTKKERVREMSSFVQSEERNRLFVLAARTVT